MKEIKEKFEKLNHLEIQILEVSLKEFEEKGYHRVSVDEIAAKLNIGKGTIYRHFGNKIMLFGSVILYMFQLARDFMRNAEVPEDFHEALEFFFEQIIYFSEKWGHIFQSGNSGEVWKELQNEVDKNMSMKKIYSYIIEMQDSSIDFLERILRKGIDNGIISSDINTRINAEIIQISVSNFIRVYNKRCEGMLSIQKEQPFTLDEGISELKKFIYRALQIPEKGA